jgi:hypothetical protein
MRPALPLREVLMDFFDRRAFLRGSTAAALGLAAPPDLFTSTASAQPSWDAGVVQHLLPAVSDQRILIKASFREPMLEAPILHIGNTAVEGRMSDTRGEFWRFQATDLAPGRPYTLSLTGSRGRMLCEPWTLSTFPGPDERPSSFRVLFYTCAGGHDAFDFLPTAIRKRLLLRALTFKPDALVANGDQVYWDLLSPQFARITGGASPLGERIAGKFDRSALVFGTDNETVLKRAAGPQILPIYGTDFRSIPTFFIQDDHDYFDNDEATDDIVTFPPPYFSLQLGRATRGMYYPEFLPDVARPLGLPWTSVDDRSGLSECFGTVRYGRLAEILLYDIRRTQTLAGESAVYVDLEAEKWLKARTAAREVAHLLHIPSNPPGWTAGKWGEWYPDVLGNDGKLTTKKPKLYWQPGWLKQHDRLMEAIHAMPERIPLVMSGDLHAIAIGRMMRSGKLDMHDNPINAVLTGPISTGPSKWPSGRRGTGALPPAHLDMDEAVKPIEQHGFTIADFSPDKIVLRMFKWDVKTQGPDAIEALEPFHTAELIKPV